MGYFAEVWNTTWAVKRLNLSLALMLCGKGCAAPLIPEHTQEAEGGTGIASRVCVCTRTDKYKNL